MTSELTKDLKNLVKLLSEKVNPRKITRYYSIDDKDTTLQSHRFGATWGATLNARLYPTAALDDRTIKDHETVASNKAIYTTLEGENKFKAIGQVSIILKGGSFEFHFSMDHIESRPGHFIAPAGVYKLKMTSGSGRHFGKTGHLKLTIPPDAPMLRKVDIYLY